VSDKQKLIVVWPYRFRDFDWQRFELEFLSEHLEVHIHELIDALTPEFAAAYANQSESTHVTRFSSLKQWRQEFNKISKDAIVFSHIKPTNFRLMRVCRTMSRSTSLVVGFVVGGAVVPSSSDGGKFQTLVRFLKISYHFGRRNLLRRWSPKLVVSGGSESHGFIKRDFPRTSKIIAANSSDYSQFLRSNRVKVVKENAAVYLDTGFPGFPRDELLKGRSEKILAENWYPNLSKFFSQVEDSLEIKIDIAVHPKHIGRDHREFFGNRKSLSGQTDSLVAARELVIATNSTAISYAISYNKPLILVWSDLIESGIDPRKRSFILNFSLATGATIFNIDREYSEQELREALVIDHGKYESYKQKYLTSRTDGKPNYQVILEEIINAKH
jgi:hypothetical protein